MFQDYYLTYAPVASTSTAIMPRATYQQQPQSYQPTASSSATAQQQPQAKAFDFTKRKKWADLLINELSGTIMMVLTNAGKLLFCGEGALELVGWKEDVLDLPITELMHRDDQAEFVAQFNACLMNRSELAIFVRLKHKNPIPGANARAQWPLYEIRGHPHFSPSATNECICFFAMARPYPSKNGAMLDFFLELKINNESLRQQLHDLRASGIHLAAGPGGLPAVPQDGSPGNDTSDDADAAYQPPSIQGLSMPPTHMRMPSTGDSTAQRNADGERSRTVTGEEETDENGAKRKKPRRSFAVEQHYVCVTCGRTDSPEWRKGPLGPKTLCNACGLRHSKRTKKKPGEEPDIITIRQHDQQQFSSIAHQHNPPITLSSNAPAQSLNLDYHVPHHQPMPLDYGGMNGMNSMPTHSRMGSMVGMEMMGDLPNNGQQARGLAPIQTHIVRHPMGPDEYTSSSAMSYPTSAIQHEGQQFSYQEMQMRDHERDGFR